MVRNRSQEGVRERVFLTTKGLGMLVLTRKAGQSVIIIDPSGKRHKVMCVSHRLDKARLGFDFPVGWSVHREEVQEEIDMQRQGKPVPSNREIQ